MKVYHAAGIEEKLGLNRERLIAMALLLGSDYTDGAKNVGPETAMKLLGKDGTLSDANVFERYNCNFQQICIFLKYRHTCMNV